MQYPAFDAHKHYTWARVERLDGTLVREKKISHERGALQQFLADCEPGSPVAVETVGNWYWIVDEVEAAGCLPQLVHARKAKLMLGTVNKTDLFGKRGRRELQPVLGELPPQTGFVVSRLLEQVERLDVEIEALEQRMGDLFEVDEAMRLLMTLPGVGFILAAVIRTEIGDVRRFARNEELAAYAGTVPRVHESGGRRHDGPVRSDVNRYLKWAFMEAANGVCRHRRTHGQRHTTRLYERIAGRGDIRRRLRQSPGTSPRRRIGC